MSMSTDTADSLLAAPFLWPLAAARNWSSWMNLAPQFLNQPINPGWTLGSVINITENNSSAPDTEREVLAHHSYGRQLGRIIDALLVVIDQTLPDPSQLEPAQRECLADFTAMSDKIRKIKEAEARKRVERIARDLTFLKDKHPDEYRKLQALLSASAPGSK
ncbi:MAG TPA: hypothetical protein VKI18_03020 [Albitalea sp.]|nr:hypothetical protein [Albitalea sp.]